MAWPKMTPGVCQVCGEPPRAPGTFFCEEHKEAPQRPKDKSTWAHPPQLRGSQSPGGREQGEEEAAPPDSELVDTQQPPPPPAPANPKPTKRRLRDFFAGKPKGETPKPAKAKVVKPSRLPKAPGGRRRSGSIMLGEGWAQLGKWLQTTPLAGAGLAMSFQGEAAGPILDEALKGTLVDRVGLQPALALEERYGAALDLAVFPVKSQMVLTFLTQHRAALTVGDLQAAAVKEIQLNMAIDSWKATARKMVPALARAVKVKREQDAQIQAAFDQTWPELAGRVDETGQPVDVGDVLFAEILGPLFVAPPQPQPEGMAPNGKQPGRGPEDAGVEGVDVAQ